MPFLSDKARSSQLRAIFTLPAHFQEPQSVFEICTNTLEAATSAATQVATPQLARCATFPLAHVHITPSIQFPINHVSSSIRISHQYQKRFSLWAPGATLRHLPRRLHVPRVEVPHAVTPQIVSMRVSTPCAPKNVV